jgi:hypothetical protein
MLLNLPVLSKRRKLSKTDKILTLSEMNIYSGLD